MYLWAKFPLDTGSNLNVRASSECLMNVKFTWFVQGAMGQMFCARALQSLKMH